MFRRHLPLSFLMVVLPFSVGATVSRPSAPRASNPSLSLRERQLWRSPNRASQFSNVPQLSTHSSCEDNQPPQALATPDPLIPAGASAKVKVTFIIGTDGRVHSPLILQSAGPVGDRSVLQTVRHWRYRPATCNGVPTDTEGRIEFSQR